MKLSLGTVAGIVAGVGLFLYAVVSNTTNYLMFVSTSSLLLVLGGSIAATFISFDERSILSAFRDMTRILFASKVNSRSLFSDIEHIIEWANVVRREGLLALEDTLEKASKGDTYLALGARLLMSNYTTAQLRELLERIRDSEYERNLNNVDVMNHMAAVAPAFGMVGTLVGMMIMLDNVDGDVGALGGGLAVSLLTTLYGVLLAQLLFKPTAAKIQQKYDRKSFRNTLVLEGLILLSDGVSPGRIEDSLNSFLEPSLYFTVADRKARDAASVTEAMAG